MNKEYVIVKTQNYVRNILEGEGSGHDWWHIYRVWDLSKQINKSEGGDSFVISLSALLHDIADWKFYDGDEKIGQMKAKEFLTKYDIKQDVIDHVCEIVHDISFKCQNSTILENCGLLCKPQIIKWNSEHAQKPLNN